MMGVFIILARLAMMFAALSIIGGVYGWFNKLILALFILDGLVWNFQMFKKHDYNVRDILLDGIGTKEAKK